METLIQRLVTNPHDGEALAYAHRAGEQDPRSYAMLLERVGSSTADPSYAAHWLSEAANVWSTTIGDAHHAARTLMIAIDKDPTQRTAAERLAQLYRDKGDQKALAALLERLVKALTPLLFERPEVRAQLTTLHEELGRLWSEPPLSRPERSLENWRRLAELDPHNVYAIYAAREMLKAQQQYAEAIPYFAMEQALVDDPERRLALLRDEADIRRRAGDLVGSTVALRNARAFLPHDVGLIQALGVAIVDRIEAGEPVPQPERDEAAELFVALAETYDGEYGYSYSVYALRAAPGHDRAMQLADHYAKQLGCTAELRPRYLAYLQVNPNGFMAAEARKRASVPPPPPRLPSVPPPASAVAASSRSPSAPPAAAAAPSYPPSPASSVPAPPVAAAIAAEPAIAAFAPAAPLAATPAAPAPLSSAAAPSSRPAPGAPGSTPAPGALGGSSLADAPQPLNEEQLAELRRPQPLARLREVLKADPANPDALGQVEEQLRQKRSFGELRDVLLAAARVPTAPVERRKAQLREVAGLCESQLRDVDTAVQAWRLLSELDPADPQAQAELRRLLERSARWDDLAALLEQEAAATPDVAQKIEIEKKLVSLHEQKRRDPIAAAEAWVRVAGLSPEDGTAIQAAVKLFERGERFDLAAQVLADAASRFQDKLTRAPLLQKLGELRMRLGEPGAAGDAFSQVAELVRQPKLWEHAEKAYLAAGRLVEAARALCERALLVDRKARPVLFVQAAELLLSAGDVEGALDRVARAIELDPAGDAAAPAIEDLYRRTHRLPELARFLLARAELLGDRAQRVAARRAAAAVQRELGDRDGERATLSLLLSDGDDAEALTRLAEDASERGDHQLGAELLRRLSALTDSNPGKISIAMREARMLAEGSGDIDAAIARYEAIVADLDPQNRNALRAIAALEGQRGNLRGAAGALERELALVDGPEQLDIAQRLAALYEGPLDDPHGAVRALEVVHAAEPDDLDAVARLLRLAERLNDWPKVARLMALLIEVEGDEDEASTMTRRLAEILDQALGRSDEAMALLEKLADQGDEACREAYVALGDRLGWKGVVATKLVAWNESIARAGRDVALRGAFERFVEVGRHRDAARVAMELARSRTADAALGEKLEAIAVELQDREALSVAHDLLARDLAGPARAVELVRQAEVRVSVGADPLEAVHHGEGALASVPTAEVEPLLVRLAALADAPSLIIDLFERQVGRCRTPADRLAALARAAEIACERGAIDRARSFFELALGGGVQEDTIATLERVARDGDERSRSTALRSILADALAAGGQGSRDGGRTRAALLRRAAAIAHQDLGDVDRAFSWLGDAVLAHVDDASLDALEALGREVGDPHRVGVTLNRALDEVFDGPLVRKLLQRRSRLRRDVLGDRQGAAADLKKLHDLSPSDQDVMNELSGLLLELGDHRGMIQLYEDQILRGRDPAQRAELARKVARIWEEELGEAREAADAWRRVLRMKAGDPDATAGLERAKAGNLKRTPPPPVLPTRPPGPSLTEPPLAPRVPTLETLGAEAAVTAAAAGAAVAVAANGHAGPGMDAAAEALPEELAAAPAPQPEPQQAEATHGDPSYDAAGADASGADVSGADASGADVSGADASGADVSGADASVGAVGVALESGQELAPEGAGIVAPAELAGDEAAPAQPSDLDGHAPQQAAAGDFALPPTVDPPAMPPLPLSDEVDVDAEEVEFLDDEPGAP
ncbi:pentapeptide repeat-containing protein [Sorangium sp. So ce233]|uniref:tetratricopeptide repeat protein n=1 Tax=Sorangium sp. So ce233 TaxID=3133290 RepID=UPI003F64841D